jgi:ATP-dependent helicase HrpB
MALRELGLPIAAVLPALSEALARGHAVLTAPTGSGKTTGVPLALLDAGWLHGGSILLLEPRRPAARLAAAHMAAMLGETVGQTVGHQVRFERRIGPDTRIQVLTEGILTRRIQSDPELTGCGLLIFDEFHERSLNADLGLALALDAAALRPDLRILVMSATLDTAAVAALLGGAPIIEGRGRSHPVTIEHLERPAADPLAEMPAAIRRALAGHDGDVLAFLPGAAEINRVAARLDGLPDGDVLPLHGSLPLAEQDRALRPDVSGRRRVVLATDIAETSLTIEGIGVVVDAGLTRKPRFEPGRGLTRLVTEPIPRDSAEQRAGRAGRLGPGHCIRLWTRADHQRRAARRPPEILNADLAPLVLELALWGVSDPADLAWLDPPPLGAWQQGLALLRQLGAVDEVGAITAAGRRMAALPLHPRLAHLLTLAPVPALGTAADLAALLSERDPAVSVPGRPRSADLGERLGALSAHRDGRTAHGFDRRRLAAVDRAAVEFRRRLRDAGTGADVPGQAPAPSAGGLLSLAYPDRVAQRRGGDDGRYALANGSGAALPPDDALAVHRYLVVADLDAASGDHRIRAALPLDEGELRTLLADRIEHRSTLTWDDARGAVAARDETRLGALALDARPAPVRDAGAALRLLLDAVIGDLDKGLTWTPAARQFQARVALARRVEPEAGWPDLSDAWLAAHAADWLAPWLAGATRLSDARALDLHQILAQLLGWEPAARLDAMVPTHLITPAGTRRPVDYVTGDEPVLAAPMQELFGAIETPSICGGRVPLLLHLLSPAGRPLQVTRDLPAFWRGAYAEVRKEMRGRYPKHHWPEDPTAAAPLKGGLKRRMAPL